MTEQKMQTLAGLAGLVLRKVTPEEVGYEAAFYHEHPIFRTIRKKDWGLTGPVLTQHGGGGYMTKNDAIHTICYALRIPCQAKHNCYRRTAESYMAPEHTLDEAMELTVWPSRLVYGENRQEEDRANGRSLMTFREALPVAEAAGLTTEQALANFNRASHEQNLETERIRRANGLLG